MCVARACLNPFRHVVDEVFDLPCGCQAEVYLCGCHCSDHDHEVCDRQPVAELEKTR